MSDYYIIPEAPTLVRDKRSKALLSVDKVGLAAALAARKSSDQITMLSNEINNMKDDISEIKVLLKELANGRTTSTD